MRDKRKLITAALLILGAFGTVRAQKSDDQGATLDVGASAGVQAQIDPGEMTSRAGSMIADR